MNNTRWNERGRLLGHQHNTEGDSLRELQVRQEYKSSGSVLAFHPSHLRKHFQMHLGA